MLTRWRTRTGGVRDSRALWLELQGDLTGMSPLGRQVIAEGSGHFIQRSDPELVARSIREVLAAVRG